MSGQKKYRSWAKQQTVVAFSVSYQRENLLARGMGLEHLRELLIRLARPILRQGASLAYGGHWEETEDNFTYDLLRLISAEQEDNSLGGPDTNLQIGTLYNHSAWPHYLKISRRIEAQWINACRIVRVTQQDAGFADPDIAVDEGADAKTPRAMFNAAVTLSAMRRLMMTEMSIPLPDLPSPERIPAVIARILLGGKLDSFTGFLPGLFEETLVTLERARPVYILGGFGGAAEVLANTILANENKRPQELTLKWLTDRNSKLAALLEIAKGFAMPAGARSTEALLDTLFAFLENARTNPSAVLHTGLSDEDTRELMKTRNVATAVNLVRQGLVATEKFQQLPA
jgi:SLOG cluster2